MKKILEYTKKTPYFKKLLDEYNSNEELKITNTNDNVSILMLTHIFRSNDENMILVAPNLFNAQKLFDKLNYIHFCISAHSI